MAATPARLIVASSETSSELRYATQFLVSDPVIFLDHKGKRTLVLSDLEIDRGKREAQVEEIVALSDLNRSLKNGPGDPTLSESVARFLHQRRLKKVHVPSDFPLGLARHLEAAGLELVPVEGLFYPEREFKSSAEIKLVQRALRITQTGMARGFEVLHATTIGPRRALLWGGKKLTSEILRAEIDSAILHAGGQPAHTIVAGGNQACDPHERGHGPLYADSLIILDIFPRDATTGYFGDLTRTVVRGRASDAQRQLWQTVLAGQRLALQKMKPGLAGAALHQEIKDFFTRQGYPTALRDGRWGGFFHGTGHGLGLDIHEIPRFGKTTFRPGQVLTVEPGLYYYGLGGVRHEDVVTITDQGIKMLSSHPKPLEI